MHMNHVLNIPHITPTRGAGRNGPQAGGDPKRELQGRYLGGAAATARAHRLFLRRTKTFIGIKRKKEKRLLVHTITKY